ncbi:MAG: Enoyl-CoA hydratase [uncultured Thermomicrobiales bacterium]|uniref:Enoyl-CoA hydratase n=1 Tax=uncultured Thermomicrobiales bacterium TaxID=1645740 RepID=A0A6J4VCD5_9BACT|nr:MAG: Enoyl-CoA hydratase [uncultured Thermomicrobiales bacterium]
MEFEQIRYEVDEGIATVTLSRPEKLNAYTERMRDEIIAAFDRIDADDAVRAVIVTGEGRGFCAGADLGGDPGPSSDAVPDEVGHWRDGGGQVTLRIFQSLKPVIAAINGPAVGVGATMTLAMDVRLASETAKMGFVFVRRGLTPEACSSFFLPRVVGISQALEWCLTGRVFPAQEALAGGLVSRVLPADDLLPAARALAREMADGTSPVSVALTRQLMWRGLGLRHPMEAHRVDSRSFRSRMQSADVVEGVVSFLEKRPPAFPQTVSADMPAFFPWWDEPEFR